MAMHITKKFLLLSFIALCTFPYILHGMYIQKSPVTLKIEQAKKAIALEKEAKAAALKKTNAQTSSGAVNAPVIITKKDQNESEATAQKTTDSSHQYSIDALVKTINSEDYLKSATETIALLEESLLNTIIQEPLSSTTFDSLYNLNPNAAQKLTDILISKTNADANLLKFYQAKLETQIIQFPQQEPSILFFNKETIIYSTKTDTKYIMNVIKRNDPNEKTTFNFNDDIRNIYGSPNGSFCILKFSEPNTHKILDLKTLEITDIQLTDDNKGAWCFIADDTVLMSSANGKFAYLYLPDNKVIPLKMQATLKPNETIMNVACRAQQDGTIQQIVASTSNSRIFVYNKETRLQGFINASAIKTIHQILIDHTGKTAYITSYKLHNNEYRLSCIDLSSNKPSLIIKDQSTLLDIPNLAITNDDKLLTMIKNKSDSETDIIKYTSYNFTLSKNFNTWDKLLNDHCYVQVLSADGKESIEKCSGTFNFVTLYDNNMTEALNYLDTSKTNSLYTNQQKLLGTILIHILLNRPSSIAHNETETKIYQTCLPKIIQTMLTEITANPKPITQSSPSSQRIAKKIAHTILQKPNIQVPSKKVKIPDIIAKKSEYLKNLALDTGIQKITEIEDPNINQEAIDLLAAMHNTPNNLNLESNSVTTLVEAANAEEFLNIEKNDPLASTVDTPSLEKTIFNKILQKALSPDILNSLKKINPDIAQKILNELIKTTRIDENLLRDYQAKLEKKPAPQLDTWFHRNPHILFFNKNEIYTMRDGFKDVKNNAIRIINRNDPNKNKIYTLGEYVFKGIDINPNGSLLVLKSDAYTHTLLKITDSAITATNLSLPTGAYCFTSNDTLCIVNAENELILLNLLNNTTTKQPITIDLNQNEIVIKISCKENNNEVLQVVALTKDLATGRQRIFIYNKNMALTTFIKAQDLFINTKGTNQQIKYLKNILLNKSGTTVYVEGATDNETALFSINLDYSDLTINDLIEQSFRSTYIQNFSLTNDEKILIISYPKENHFKLNDNTWYGDRLDHNCYKKNISADGREGIEECQHTYSKSWRIATLYDDNMAAALDYLDINKTNNFYTVQQRLLGALLIHTILNQHSSTALNETETKIYQTCLPQEIQTMLTKITNLQLSTNTEQINQTDTPVFMQKLSTWYNYFMDKKQ